MDTHEVRLQIEPGVALDGFLEVPPGAPGLVLFAHGSGSGRHSPRNQAVARVFREAGLGTLLFDLLTPAEETFDRRTKRLRFDIGLLAGRMGGAAAWLRAQPDHAALRLGFIGSSTGGAAAIVAATQRPDLCDAVVSRGGRPDLAGPALPFVRAPTLLIVGELDPLVLDLNRQAFDELKCEKRLDLVPGAGHLFEEPGTLDQASILARAWFLEHFCR